MDRETRLREELVKRLQRTGVLHSGPVAAAMRAVPRHRFLPGGDAADAYDDRAIALDERDGVVLSSISQPSMIAEMLELLAIAPGDRVLEIGTGSGYNAALLAELAGPSGSVTSIELEPAIGERAARALHDAGYERVELVNGDGAAALAGARSFERIAVTARCDDIAGAWWEALVEGGRMVLPLQLGAAGEFAVGFERRAGRLHGIGQHPCAFIGLRGEARTEGAPHLFFRDASAPPSALFARKIASIDAVRSQDATPQLLADADLVVARSVTMFAIRFTS